MLAGLGRLVRQDGSTRSAGVLAGSDRLAWMLAGWAEATGTFTQQGAGRIAGRWGADAGRVVAACASTG